MDLYAMNLEQQKKDQWWNKKLLSTIIKVVKYRESIRKKQDAMGEKKQKYLKKT